MNANIIEVTLDNYDREVVDSNLPVLIDFWSLECGACIALNPLIDLLEKNYQGKVKIVKVNAKDEPVIAARYRVRGLPTLLLTKNGEVVRQIEPTRSRLFDAIDDYIGIV